MIDVLDAPLIEMFEPPMLQVAKTYPVSYIVSDLIENFMTPEVRRVDAQRE